MTSSPPFICQTAHIGATTGMCRLLWHHATDGTADCRAPSPTAPLSAAPTDRHQRQHLQGIPPQQCQQFPPTAVHDLHGGNGHFPRRQFRTGKADKGHTPQPQTDINPAQQTQHPSTNSCTAQNRYGAPSVRWAAVCPSWYALNRQSVTACSSSVRSRVFCNASISRFPVPAGRQQGSRDTAPVQ